MQACFDSCVWIPVTHPKNHTPTSRFEPSTTFHHAGCFFSNHSSETENSGHHRVSLLGPARVALAFGNTSTINPLARKLSMRLGVSTSEPDPLVPKAQPAGTRLTMGIREGIEKPDWRLRQSSRLSGRSMKPPRLRPSAWHTGGLTSPYPKQTNSILAYNPSRYDVLNPETFNDDPVMENAVDDHAFMTCFYKNPQIDWPEFEQLYHLLEAVDRGDNPRITAEIFSCLQLYHKTVYYGRDAFGPKTPEEAYESYADPIVGMLVLDRYWPDRPP